MRFTKPFWDGIADGSITVAYRGWNRPTVVAGRPYRTGGGRIEVVSVDEPDPREALAAEGDLADADVADISTRLARLDRASSFGPWTTETLRLVEANPARRAPDLAEMVGRETKAFKLDVRKLENLGLTTSLRIGYELSPRGRAYLDAIDEG